jgi:hypothetical protein
MNDFGFAGSITVCTSPDSCRLMINIAKKIHAATVAAIAKTILMAFFMARMITHHSKMGKCSHFAPFDFAQGEEKPSCQAKTRHLPAYRIINRDLDLRNVNEPSLCCLLRK